LAKIVKSKVLTELEAFNSQWIERYIDQEKKGLSLGRKKKIRLTLGKIGREQINKRFDQITRDDLEEWIETLKAEDFEDSTKITYLKIAKPFFTWMHNLDDPNFASWIQTHNYQTTVGPEDILNEAELNQIRSILKTPRDKTMFEVLYESALRPAEFLALRRSDVSFDTDSAMIHIRKGKTGFSRDIPLVGNARALLSQWILNEHPLRNDSHFPLWINMSSNSSYDPLQQQGLRKFMARIADLGRVQKRVVPYTLRHTRLTDLARMGANEAILCQIAGWKQGSGMASVYIHLSGRDSKPALMKLYGIQQEKSDKPIIQLPKVCPNCKEPNSFEAKLCWRCKLPIDPQTMLAMIKEKTKNDQRMEALELQVKALADALIPKEFDTKVNKVLGPFETNI
jgi:integrase/recombinase XerD